MRIEVRAIIDWYRLNQRDLPWRRPGVSAWGVLVSEFMLQQTPTARVLQPWQDWMERWPTPDALAEEPGSAAVAAWGRLGYPRRALRLHATAVRIAQQHDGEVPTDIADLLALPGVGEYTAAAIASFAHRQRHVVLDTNVRRVLARLRDGVQYPTTSPNRAEYALAEGWLPDSAEDAATWAVAAMELGAIVCRARTPGCAACPVAASCAWLAAGRPAHAGPPRRGQSWDGTDRQCRGQLLDIVRNSDGGVPVVQLLAGWQDADQATRCLDALVADRLVRRHDGLVRL